MIDRRNRRVAAVIGLVLMFGGGLSACLGAGVFGKARADRAVFDSTVVRWWNEGGWESFAVVTALGAVAVTFGLILALPQLRRNDARYRTPTIIFPPPAEHGRGETTLRAPALSHRLEADLARIPEVKGAMVGLFGRYPNIELRAMLDISDHINLDQLPDQVEGVLDRMHTTTGIRPGPIVVTVRFNSANRERQIR
jgi:hypothetical protein